MPLLNPKTFFITKAKVTVTLFATVTFALSLTLIFPSLSYAASSLDKKTSSSSLKFTLPPPIKPKLPLFKPNSPIRIKNSTLQVLAGFKLPNIPIYVNNKLVISPNKYTSWYYEYPLSSKSNKVIISSAPITSISQLRNATILNLDSITALDVDPPRIFGYRVDPSTRDFFFNIQDPPGVLSYNVYYANSISGSLNTTPFILAQANVPVSGTGTTTWRDNGTFTGKHPSQVTMRFYKLEVNRVDTINPIIVISTPQEGEVVGDE